MKIAFTGRRKLGGAKMRAVSVAKFLDLPFIDIGELHKRKERFDVIVHVKYWADNETARLIRSRCDRLIFDPLDCWMQPPKFRNSNPVDFWKYTRSKLGWDEIIATSNSCASTMSRAISEMGSNCPVRVLPHHADPRIKSGWHNPAGPIVYTGGAQYMGDHGDLYEAAHNIGRKLIIHQGNDSWQGLKGAALMLHLRRGNSDTAINRFCKPQVKLANAAAAGLPVLSTNHPCTVSHRHGAFEYYDAYPSMQIAFERAMTSEKLKNPITLKEHSEKIMEVAEHGRWTG